MVSGMTFPQLACFRSELISEDDLVLSYCVMGLVGQRIREGCSSGVGKWVEFHVDRARGDKCDDLSSEYLNE